MKLILPKGMVYSYMQGWFWLLSSLSKRNEDLDVAFFLQDVEKKKSNDQ